MSSDAMCIGLLCIASIRYIAGLYGLFHVKNIVFLYHLNFPLLVYSLIYTQGKN